MLREMRDRVKNLFKLNTSPTIDQAQRAATDARQTRASSVTNLQMEVRRIQQEITDLSDALESGSSGGKHNADEAQLASLQRLLEQKQRELSRFQARI